MTKGQVEPVGNARNMTTDHRTVRMFYLDGLYVVNVLVARASVWRQAFPSFLPGCIRRLKPCADAYFWRLGILPGYRILFSRMSMSNVSHVVCWLKMKGMKSFLQSFSDLLNFCYYSLLLINYFFLVLLLTSYSPHSALPYCLYVNWIIIPLL